MASSPAEPLDLGGEKGMTLDWDGEDAPVVGDELRTTRTRYLIVSLRRVRSRVHPSRWAVRMRPILAGDHPGRVFEFRWHARGPS